MSGSQGYGQAKFRILYKTRGPQARHGAIYMRANAERKKRRRGNGKAALGAGKKLSEGGTIR